jgi:hypothetical protein
MRRAVAGNAGNLPPRVMGASVTLLGVALMLATLLTSGGRVSAQELPTQPPSRPRTRPRRRPSSLPAHLTSTPLPRAW